MRRKFVLLALRYPKLKLLLLRRSYPELYNNHVLPLQEELYDFAQYKSDDKSFMFPNGSRLKLGYCDAESDVYQFLGTEWDVIGFEEACLFTETQIQFILTCLRSIREDFKPRAYMTCNPGGPAHNYIKRLFIDREFYENENPDDYNFIPARVYDNTVLMDANPDYVRTLEALPEDLRRAHLEGDFGVFMGQFFREFREPIHVVTPFTIPDYWKKFCSLDYGLDMTACYWWAVSDEGQCFIYRELHEPDLTLSQAAEKIVKLTPDNEHISYVVASPDLWNRRQDRGSPGTEVMYSSGLKNLIKANNNRIPGCSIMHEHLKPYKAKDEQGNEITTAKLQIFSCCPMLIKYLPMVQYDPNRPEDASDKPHYISHCVESIRYGCCSRHPEFSTQEKLYFPKGTSEADKQRIVTNLEFEKVYSKMQNKNKVYGGW